MTHARLNLLALRADRVPWLDPDGAPRPSNQAPAPPAADIPVAPAPLPTAATALQAADLAAVPISRRRLIGLAAGAAGAAGVAAAGPVGRALAAGAYPDFDLDLRPGRAVFGLAGAPRWIVDTARFAGTPRLTVQRDPDAIALTLRGARFPGTALAADLDARIWRESASDTWRLHLALPGLAFAAEVPFVAWLAGAAEARGRARPAAAWPLGAGHHVHVAGAATATFAPDWTLRLAGDRIGRAVSGGAAGAAAFDLAADRVRVSLPPPGGASLLSRPGTLRTLVALERGDRRWRFTPRWELPGAARLDWPDEPFDAVYAESTEDLAAAPRHALTLESRGGGPALFPGRGATDADGRPFALPLGRVRYAAALDAGSTAPAAVLVGWLGEGSPWLQVPGGAAARLADPAGGPAFELAAEAGGPPVLTVAPAVTALALPVPDRGVAVDARLPDGARARFRWSAHLPREPSPDRSTTRAARAGAATTARAGTPVLDLHFTADGLDGVTQAAALDLVVLRPDDLLVLGFAFDNLVLRPGANPGEPGRLVAADTGRPSRVVVHFPPQHIAERASLDEGQPELVAPTPPVPAALASPSRLAFDVPASLQAAGIPYTLDSLLDWGRLTPRPGPQGTVRRPTASETALVVPYRLILSPEVDDDPAWAHARQPVTFDGRTELWHTRLGRDGADGSREVAGVDAVDERTPARLRAVWTESFDPNQALFLGCNHPLVGDPFAPMSLTPADRAAVTMLTGTGADRIATRRLFLSALGAWLDVAYDRGAGNDNCPTPLESWTHKAAMGRDFFVRVVYRGTLLPFGHRAALIKVTERKFERDAADDTVAALWQRQFLVVREPEKAFNNRKLPFRRVRILTESTPSLRLTSAAAKLGSLAADGNGGFWPIVLVDGADRDFPFQVAATDWDGHTVDLAMPMAWLAEGASLAVARAAYNAETGARVKRPMAGQKVAFAAGTGGGGGEGGGGAEGGASTRLETLALTFAMDAAGVTPILARAGVIVEPLKNLIGADTPVDILYDDTYLAHGFDAASNVGEVFAKLADKLPLDFGGGGQGDRGGGLVTPNFDVSGLSRKLGAVAGDLANLAGGTFDPADFLDVAALGNKAKVLGYDILDKILAVVPPAEFGDGAKVPKVVTRVDVPSQTAVTEIDWSPKVIQFIPFQFNTGGTTAFTIHATLRARLDAGAGATAEFDVLCELTYFAIDLVAIRLTFDRLKFTAGSGKATSLVPEIAAVNFGGPLKFIEKLKEVMSSDVLGVGPKIDVTPTGIVAGISVGLPSVAVGVFSLENIRLSAALNVPLTGEMVRFRFAFCERQSPFVLTVSAFGGGGYFAVHLGADGLAKLEMALEFGAQLSMSIGIASGSVGIMAGIYLELTKNEEGGTDVLLTGYLRCWGELDILGLISISAEFYLAFTYDSARNSCRGQAKLTVKIEILFFEKTFTLSVEREFRNQGGGGFLLADGRTLADAQGRALEAPAGGIAFADLYTAPDWAAYCGAFA